MKKKLIIMAVIVIAVIAAVVFINCYPIYVPIRAEDIPVADEVSNFDAAFSDKVSMNDALEAVLKVAGANEEVFNLYGYGIDYGSIPFNPDNFDWENAGVPFTAWHIGNLLVYYNIFNDDNYYYANKPATVRQVAVMMQACLEDTGETIKIGGIEYHKLFYHAKKNGLIKKCDLIYWTDADSKITYAQLHVLLDRFKDQKRYKYFDCNNRDMDAWGHVVYDKERSATYRDGVSGELRSDEYRKLRGLLFNNSLLFTNIIDVVLADKSDRTEYDLHDVEQMIAENPDGYMTLYLEEFIKLRDELGFEYIRKTEDGIKFYPLRDEDHSATLGLFTYKGEVGLNEWEFFELD